MHAGLRGCRPQDREKPAASRNCANNASRFNSTAPLTKMTSNGAAEATPSLSGPSKTGNPDVAKAAFVKAARSGSDSSATTFGVDPREDRRGIASAGCNIENMLAGLHGRRLKQACRRSSAPADGAPTCRASTARFSGQYPNRPDRRAAGGTNFSRSTARNRSMTARSVTSNVRIWLSTIVRRRAAKASVDVLD